MHPTLLLIDIQNDYFAGGAMALPHSTEAGSRAQALLASVLWGRAMAPPAK